MRVVTVCIACRLVRGRAPTTASPLERVRERGCSPRTDLVYSELGRTVGRSGLVSAAETKDNARALGRCDLLSGAAPSVYVS